MKTKEELNALKEEVETVSKKLHELTEEELGQVTGRMPDLNREKEIGIGVDVSPIRMSGVL